MMDNEGGLWLATSNAGIVYLGPDWHNFSHYAHRPDDPESLAASHILALAGDRRGRIWVGGYAGQLDEFDPVTGAVIHHENELRLPQAKIQALAAAGQHGVWIATARFVGLFVDGHFRRITLPAGVNGFRQMVSDASGNLYVASFDNGIIRVDRKTLAVQALQVAFTHQADRTTHTLQIHAGELWRASHGGVGRLPAHQTRMTPVTGVTPGQVSAMVIAGHELWLARPHALEHYHLSDHRARLKRRVDAAAHWAGLVVKAVAVDERGRVWLFAADGLWRYSPDTGHFKHYGKNDGLPGSEFTARELARIGNDTIFAGTMNGVIGFHPAAITDHTRKPRLEISAIEIDRNGHRVTLPRKTHALHLNWNDRDLRVTARALSYIAPEKNHYRFLLAGVDSDWVDTGTRGMREFAGLKAGHYQLKVQAAGPDGTWSELATPLSIRVDAAPWLRAWAWLAYALAAVLIGTMVIVAWRRRLEQRHRVHLAHQQQQMAEQANAAKTHFLATLSHEIRTPMTGVLGMAELLLHADLGKRERDYALTIRHSGELLLKLLNEALDVARIEAGRVVLEPAPFQPRALIEDVRQLQLGLARKHDLTFSARIDTGVPVWLEGDAARIKQIILNLCANALKFTTYGGVTLNATYAGGELALSVSDTGPGISEKDHQRLFERFEQADGPQRKAGSGLGLAICRELVALMHGRIELQTTLGKGSRFDVFLPLAEAAAAAKAPTTRAPARATGALKLLLVEDNMTVAQVTCGLLKAHGHCVRHAANALQALGEIERERFDALLLDMNLPGMNGCELARVIRQREAHRIPIIAITARAGGGEERQARAAGMDAFLRKPLDGDELARTLHDVCPGGPATGDACPPADEPAH
jgi:signal transduction histidine kinase/CheY-like chemotaxis protein/streptogramin lyase